MRALPLRRCRHGLARQGQGWGPVRVSTDCPCNGPVTAIRSCSCDAHACAPPHHRHWRQVTGPPATQGAGDAAQPTPPLPRPASPVARPSYVWCPACRESPGAPSPLFKAAAVDWIAVPCGRVRPAFEGPAAVPQEAETCQGKRNNAARCGPQLRRWAKNDDSSLTRRGTIRVLRVPAAA